VPGVPEKMAGVTVLDPHVIAISNDSDFDSEESVYVQEGNNVGKDKINSAYYAQESATINERYGLGPVTDFSTKNSP
jgi:hypothetical protein